MVESGNDNISFSLAATSRTQANTGPSITARTIAGISLYGDNYIEYKNALPQTDLLYAVQNYGVKEYIVLNSPKAPNMFSFNFSAQGYSAEKTEHGTVEFRNANGEAVFELSSLFAVDSIGAYTEELAYSVTKSAKGRYEITVSLSKEYVEDKARVFPVLIDPTAVVMGMAKTNDAHVESQRPYAVFDFPQLFYTGKTSVGGVNRTYIKFEIPNYIKDSHIYAADLDIVKAGGAAPLLEVYRVTKDWSASTICWNNKPGYTTVNRSRARMLADNKTLRASVAEIVKEWAKENYSYNYGFLLKDERENNTSIWTSYHSSESRTPYGDLPSLRIFYSTNFYMNFGYYSNIIDIKPYSYTTVWQNAMDKSLSNWNSARANIQFEKSSISKNQIILVPSISADYGVIIYGLNHAEELSGSKLKRFSVYLNVSAIQASAANGSLSNVIQSTLVHELGHSIWLMDNPATPSASIMKHDRDRNKMTKPSSLDVNNVKAKY